MESPETNRGVSLIAKSVTSEDPRQSYIAVDHPRWLHELFTNERFSTSVSCFLKNFLLTGF